MQLTHLALLVLMVHAVAVAGLYDYCKFKNCQPKTQKHTVCQTKCRRRPNSQLIPQTFEFRKKMVGWHNKLRQVIASGQNTTGGNANASNMMVISYDMELEFVMSCWLVTLEMIEHDKCRGTPGFVAVGQNLFFSTWTPNKGPPDGDKIIEQLMMSYFSEIKAMSADQIDKFTGKSHNVGEAIGHFTQLVWATTKYIGCAITLVNHTKEQRVLQGCNFGPAGNIKEKTVYERGKPASKCPPGTKANSKYPALCGEMRPYEAAAMKTGNPTFRHYSGCTGLTPELGSVLIAALLFGLSY